MGKDFAAGSWRQPLRETEGASGHVFQVCVACVCVYGHNPLTFSRLFHKRVNLYWIEANPLIPSIYTSIYSPSSTFPTMIVFNLHKCGARTRGRDCSVLLMQREDDVIWPRSQSLRGQSWLLLGVTFFLVLVLAPFFHFFKPGGRH